MVEPLRHRRTKGAATDMFYLTPPRHTSTLPVMPTKQTSANVHGLMRSRLRRRGRRLPSCRISASAQRIVMQSLFSERIAPPVKKTILYRLLVAKRVTLCTHRRCPWRNAIVLAGEAALREAFARSSDKPGSRRESSMHIHRRGQL